LIARIEDLLRRESGNRPPIAAPDRHYRKCRAPPGMALRVVANALRPQRKAA
jgi:hypothetical protein